MPEPILARIHILINSDSVANDIDDPLILVSFEAYREHNLCEQKEKNSPKDCRFSSNRDEGL